MTFSVELVPSSLERLESELCELKTHFPDINTVNIVDLKKFSMRSWQACEHARRHSYNSIPHIRAVDIDLNEPLTFAQDLLEHGVKDVLVVTGDVPTDMTHTHFDSSAIQIIRKFRKELPELNVYAALDPYRQSFVKEIAYAKEKLEAGAVGLFSQPFFDLRLLNIYAELLDGADVYWGVTTVTSSRSHSYWRNRNKAVFPAGFEPTLQWSRGFAKEAVQFARDNNQNLYFMPIKTSTKDFLEGIL